MHSRRFPGCFVSAGVARLGRMPADAPPIAVCRSDPFSGGPAMYGPAIRVAIEEGECMLKNGTWTYYPGAENLDQGLKRYATQLLAAMHREAMIEGQRQACVLVIKQLEAEKAKLREALELVKCDKWFPAMLERHRVA